ncbi:hypothetical protein ANCCAN_09300 [Ancylostoma caninum]|uniref:Uncharacterized protein n=1 Tax=Ancylostoma caninum TaxID=29170 RepID=A0A368GNT0_ANCCA|nr:hypothetical protein ANCCAN_09300 [Ancylostoma caninum]
MIPAYLRQGHRYYIEVDNIGTHFIYKGIAVYSTGKRVYFGELSEDNDCTQFAGLGGIYQACEYNHFLLHANDRFHQRHQLDKFLKGELSCTPLEIADSIAILIKHDLANPRSEKWIGTYSKERDIAVFIGQGGKRKVYRRLWEEMRKKRQNPQMFEVMCEIKLEDAGRS